MPRSRLFTNTVFNNSTFDTKEVNLSKKKVFQNNVFNRDTFQEAYIYPPVFRNKAFNQNVFQTSWEIANTVATESIDVSAPSPN